MTKIRIIVGDTAYPEMEVPQIRVPSHAKFTNPILIKPNELFQLTEDGIVAKALRPLLIYGIAFDGRPLVKTRGMRRRKTSLKRLKTLGVIDY